MAGGGGKPQLVETCFWTWQEGQGLKDLVTLDKLGFEWKTLYILKYSNT